MDRTPPLSEIIFQRTSRRTYRPEPLAATLHTGIDDRIRQIVAGPLNTPLSFSMVDTNDTANRKLKLGTYGFIQGARHFIAGQIEPSTAGFLDYGFELEKLILELTRMGLGTCWLGGTFDRGEFARAIGLKENHIIPAITPVGYPAEYRRLGERLIRLGAGSRNRLPAEKLFFNRTPAEPLNLPEDHPWFNLLESVRVGPSASNNQPWRIIADSKKLNFHICRKPGYAKAFSRVDMQMIDMGIAMSHLDIAAREKGFEPEWKILAGEPAFDGMEYVISVFLP